VLAWSFGAPTQRIGGQKQPEHAGEKQPEHAGEGEIWEEE
jgi:hypothetical protein